MVFFLFFSFTYRYAAAGDAVGEPLSRDEEFEKMERLEKEVLDYPGLVFFAKNRWISHIILCCFRFKSNPNLVSGFEARRLPRTFLVLLENLLNKKPSIRPSSERVATAIRDGKVCFCRFFSRIGFSPFFWISLTRWKETSSKTFHLLVLGWAIMVLVMMTTMEAVEEDHWLTTRPSC